MSSPFLNVEDRQGIRWVLFNRPDVHNAQNQEMLVTLHRILLDTAGDRSIRLLVLGGNGSSFCSGHDLRAVVENEEFKEAAKSAEGRFAYEMRLFAEPVHAFRRLPIPTICRVQGNCLAAGLMFASAADFVIASQDAVFGSPVLATLGINDAEVPSFSWRVGERRAKEILWLNERVSATAAQAMGLVNWVVPESELDTKVGEVATRLMRVPREALALSKETFRFAASRQGEDDIAAYHFMAHQFSHQTRESLEILEARIKRVSQGQSPVHENRTHTEM